MTVDREIILEAYIDICKFLSKYPPMEIPSEGEYEGIVKAMIGAGVEEKGFMNYAHYFVNRVIERKWGSE